MVENRGDVAKPEESTHDALFDGQKLNYQFLGSKP